MEIEMVTCECCGLMEECTTEYICSTKANFDGKWLCGLCTEAVMDKVSNGRKSSDVEEAVISHMSFCKKFRSNPAVNVADGMRQILRRRSGLIKSSATASNKFDSSMSAS